MSCLSLNALRNRALLRKVPGQQKVAGELLYQHVSLTLGEGEGMKKEKFQETILTSSKKGLRRPVGSVKAMVHARGILSLLGARLPINLCSVQSLTGNSLQEGMGLQGTGQRLISCWRNTIKSKISSQPGKISPQGSRERRQLCY